MKCREIQEAARSFDWDYKIGDWVEFFDKSFEDAVTKLTTLASREAALGVLPLLPASYGLHLD